MAPVPNGEPLDSVTVAALATVAAWLRVTRPLAVRVRAEPVAVAFALIVKEVPLTTEAIVAPAGMPVPVMA